MADQQTEREQIGNYELVECLEEGVTGKLYRARDAETSRRVMLKVFPPALERNPAFGKYFYDRWADQQTMIEHPNVLEVREVSQEGDLRYVAYEDSGGVPLSRQMADAPLPLDDALDILHQAAEGLRAAHRRDVAHGLLKPSDIIITEDSRGNRLVKVAFLDLAVSASESMVSIFGELMGTPKYMAPEVIRGRLPGPRSDVFSLGVIAYELFTGREPFPSDHAVGYLFANCEEDPLPAEQAREDVPHEIALVVNRMLEKQPARRYRSMQHVIEDFDRCFDSIKRGHAEVVPYGSDSAFARDYGIEQPQAAGQSSGRSVLPWAALTVVLALVVGAVAYTVGAGGWQPGQEQPTEPLAAVSPAPEDPVASPVQQPIPAPEDARPEPTPEQQPQQQVETPTTPEPQPAPPPAPQPREAFSRVLRDSQRLQEQQNYDLAVARMQKLLADYPDAAFRTEAKAEMGRIYVAWARGLERDGRLEQAVERYKDALEVAPEGSEYLAAVRKSLPETMARWAEAEKAEGDYERALEIYQRIAAEHPGSVQAGLIDKRKPEIMVSSAFAAWREDADYADALATLENVVQNYPETEWAENARAAIPQVYLAAIEADLGSGDYENAQWRLEQLTEAYPEHEAAARAEELIGQILFGLFTEAREAGDQKAAAARFGELLHRRPSGPWAVRAARIRLGLERTEGEPTFSPNTARAQLNKADARFEAFEYGRAVEFLEGVITYARADSTEAQKALGLLPGWRLDHAFYLYGRDLQNQATDMLEKLAADFAGTRWQQQAEAALARIEGPPEGMVYVPEGRFRMGSEMETIFELIKEHDLSALGEDEEALRTTAEFYGLLIETPQHIETTDSFFIDATEVSNAQYKEFVDATGYAAPPHWQDGTYPEGAGELPVVRVTLNDARRYAEWRGCRLPTEAEWEKAARGTGGNRFPWGNLFDENRARVMLPAEEGPAPVHANANWESPYGCLNMIGNVFEWTVSDLAPYEGSAAEVPESPEKPKVVRGGAWMQQGVVDIPVSCASRFPWDPSMADATLGFRCVKDVPAGAAGG